MLKINETIKFTNSLRELIQTYEQIHLIKINKTRDDVIKSREYINGLSAIFTEVKSAYTNTKTNKQTPLQKKNDVAVLFTTKQRFSGNINPKIYKKFIEFIAKNPQTDIIIIGHYGKTRFDTSPHKKEYQYFEIGEGDNQFGAEALKPITGKLLGYKKINIFHGQFVNFLKQIETTSHLPDINQDINSQSFIFEPTLTELVEHFETEILTSLFRQTAKESHLAQTGSRIQTLEQAQKKISEYLDKLEVQKRRALRHKRNQKQLATLSSMTLWTGYQSLY